MSACPGDPRRAPPDALTSTGFGERLSRAFLGAWLLGVSGCAATGDSRVPSAAIAEGALFEYMSGEDVLLADRILQSALETAASGQSMTWRNPDSGNSGIVVPIRTFRLDLHGVYCREYKEILNISGRSEVYLDTACRFEGGVWKLVDT